VKNFFMVLPENTDLTLASQWKKYCEVWPTLDPALKALDIGAFWLHPDVVAKFPNGCNQLAKVATYWASFPISNVCLERAFGIMRSMEGPQRYSLSPESVCEELLIKVNAHLVDEMLVSVAGGPLGP
jgi:hypothetical protein